MRLFFLTFCAILSVSPAFAAGYNFCWIGSNGYTINGKFDVPNQSKINGLVTERDVTNFKITGYLDGFFLGRWSSSQLEPGTTWHFRFDPVTMTLPTGGEFSTIASQGWNANGQVDDCGNPGFGFNAGNFAQDICHNGEFILASSVAPDTPIHVTTAPLPQTCETRGVMSKR